MSNNLNLKTEISFNEQKEYFINNGVFGAFVHVSILIVLFTTTNLFHSINLALYFFVPLLMLINILRLSLLLKPIQTSFSKIETWNRIFKTTIVLQGLVLGTLGGIVCSHFGMKDSSALFFLVILATISSASVQSFAVCPWLAYTNQALLLIPTMILLPIYQEDEFSRFLALGTFCYLIFNSGFTKFTAQNIYKIIEQKKLLELQDLQLKSFIDSIPGYVSWFDDKMNFIKTNKFQLEQFQNSKTDDMKTINFGLNTIPKFRKEFLEFLKSDDQTLLSDYTLKVEGEIKYFLTLLSKNNIQNSFFISSVSIDVTEIRLKEIELENQKDEIKKQEKLVSLGEMAGGLAHEINNPLTVIIGRIQLIKTKLSKGEVDPQFIEQNLVSIQNTSTKIKKIITSLKALAKDSYIDTTQAYSITTVVNSTAEMMESKLENAGVKLTIEHHDPSINVYCGLVEIGQVLTNMFINSIHATEDLNEKWITIKTRLKNDMVLILEFTDSGAGIPKEIQEKLFTPLFTTKGPERGNGIGLSLSRKIMSKMNGDMYYNDSSPNTSFILEIPLIASSSSNKAPMDQNDPAA